MAASDLGPDVCELIARLSLAEKVKLLTGASTFTLHGNDAIGLAPMAFSDGPTGVRGLKFSGGNTVSLFPNATLLASSWRTDVLAEVGGLLAEEAQAQHIHVVLGPTINLHRTPLGGRLFEAYSEDPLLTGVLAGAYVAGMQERGTGACLKHLVANESETDRHSVNSVVDDATLREVYLLPFQIALQASDSWTVMAAYNDVNGVPATEHDYVNNEILKGEWRYPGLLMSDWFATKSAAPAANGGLDLVMPGPTGPWGDALLAAVESGEVAESTIDEHVRRLLVLAHRVGALGEPRAWPTQLPAPDSAQRREQLTRLAAQGMTVLRNETRGDGPVLPLPRTASVAVIGRHALATVDMGGGSAQVNPPYQSTIAAALTDTCGADRVAVYDGVAVRSRPRPANSIEVLDPVEHSPGIRIVVRATDGSVLAERHSSVATAMIGFDEHFDQPVGTVTLQAELTGDGPQRVGMIGSGQWQLDVAGQHFEQTLSPAGNDPGEGLLRPPAWTTDVSAAAGTRVEATVRAGELPFVLASLVAGPVPTADDDVIAAAVDGARDADVAVVVVGLTEESETEAADKSTLALPGRQDEMVAAVAAAARRTVVVVNAATPILMPWLAEVDAVLWAGLPGQEGGRAVAAALLGDIEPAGRLVTSFPTADGASPAWEVVPTDGALHYSEGKAIGYRGYHAGLAPQPLFWFGHGLGYGSWRYDEPTLASGADAPAARLTVHNSSSRDSREVVQLYFDPDAEGEPIRLVGWTVVDVAAGASLPVDVQADARMLRRWDVDAHDWQPLGAGDLLIARGLGDVRGRLRVD